MITKAGDQGAGRPPAALRVESTVISVMQATKSKKKSSLQAARPLALKPEPPKKVDNSSVIRLPSIQDGYMIGVLDSTSEDEEENKNQIENAKRAM